MALDLARAGHRLTALDLDPDLLAALRVRASDLDVQSVCADACSFDLPRRDFALCLVPMQTIQLLAGAPERSAFLRCALAHLRPGGLLACAIVTELEPFDIADGLPIPTPETVHVEGALYISQVESVRVRPGNVAIERARRIVSSAVRPPGAGRGADPPGAEGAVERDATERDVIELAGIDAHELEREGAQVGFHPEAVHSIEPTDEHVGSVVVMLRA